MANEISMTASLSFSKSSSSDSFATTKLIDMSGTDYRKGTQSIGTTEEAITLTDMSTVGYIVIRNNDATNFVQVGAAATGEYTIKLLAGQSCIFPPNSTTIYAKADTAACVIEILAVES